MSLGARYRASCVYVSPIMVYIYVCMRCVIESVCECVYVYVTAVNFIQTHIPSVAHLPKGNCIIFTWNLFLNHIFSIGDSGGFGNLTPKF